MKKFFIILFIILGSISLSACGDIKTYDDLYLEYQSHLTENKPVYQEVIDFFNHVSNESVQSIVLVDKVIYANSGSSSGSGVIFHEDDLYYYVLTNNHVIYSNPDNITSYIVSDYLGNEYTSFLVESDRNYDMAILKFIKGDAVLKVMNIAESNMIVDAQLSIIGYPNSQINAITMGKVIRYQETEINGTNTEIINVEFEILVSNAPVKSGSSGSAVINEDFNLAGIVFAGQFSDYSFISEFAFILPVEKIHEFLTLYNFDLGGETT